MSDKPSTLTVAIELTAIDEATAASALRALTAQVRQGMRDGVHAEAMVFKGLTIEDIKQAHDKKEF